ncbi:MAG: HdeD family acid-resistance protein [Proteobacteria bacterium]|nr:HdeD family acid-resistance protein [Pseudomonadota bacterium]MBU4277409.1 HdeD family acid-resistance protein [Pseudomonadota bacterium]MBU4384792.1 HdeD family acid-resistance protein [Pseudomonadota bacterium]MBU4605687.1 HdeD family acid-resistance protein [Pseudomonadota bacterium]MCG2764638.1 HdeD family acid-resistance protein [Desulfarculaceae bacterium]
MSAQSSQTGGGLLKDGLAELQKHRGSLLAAGIISLILGTIAILAPLAATVAVVWVIGAVILVQGIIQLVHCFKTAQWSAFAWNLLWAVVYVIAGGLILARPLLGAITLTLLLAAFFIVEGVVKLGLAMKLKPAPRWGWVLFSGIMGVVLGLIIFAGWPGDSLAIMGLLLGIDLIFGGWSMIMLASAGKSAGSVA